MDERQLRFEALQLMLRHTPDIDEAIKGAEKLVKYVLGVHTAVKTNIRKKKRRR